MHPRRSNGQTATSKQAQTLLRVVTPVRTCTTRVDAILRFETTREAAFAQKRVAAAQSQGLPSGSEADRWRVVAQARVRRDSLGDG